MTLPRIRGPLPRLRAKVSSASTWRGLSVQLGTDFYYPDGGLVAPILFDTVLVDTDGIYNGIDGGDVPVGMAGLWRLSGQVLASAASPIVGLGEMIMTVNNLVATTSYRQSYYQILADAQVMTFPFSPLVLVLDEGDMVEIQAGSGGGGAPYASALHTWMLMEYLGPAPVEES